MNRIEFVNDILALKRKDAFVLFIPIGIKSKEELLQTLSEKLQLPDYFGRNWDALSECLEDLSWIGQKEIFLIHEGLPLLEPPGLNTYIDILIEAVQYWKEGDEHKLFIVFPEQLKDQLAFLI